MGAQVSTSFSTTKEVSKIVNKVILSNKSNCSGAVASNQKITLGDITGDLNISDVNFDSSQTVNLECLQSSVNNTEILNDIKTELSKAIQNKLDGQNFGIQSATISSYTDSVTNVVNTINIDNIKNCIVNAMNNQEIETGGIVGNVNIKNVNFKSSQNVVQRCIQNDENTIRAVNKLDKRIKEDMSNTITGVISSTGFIVIVVALLVLLFLYYMFSRSKKPEQN